VGALAAAMTNAVAVEPTTSLAKNLIGAAKQAGQLLGAKLTPTPQALEVPQGTNAVDRV
jgi:hypothetical protein